MQSTRAAEAINGVLLLWLLVLFVICFNCCMSCFIFPLVLGLRIGALLGFLPLPLGLCPILGDYKAIVATLGSGEGYLVMTYRFPVSMSNGPTILDSKHNSLFLCLIPGFIDKLPQLFLILVRSVNVL